jgi:hypothetical protein
MVEVEEHQIAQHNTTREAGLAKPLRGALHGPVWDSDLKVNHDPRGHGLIMVKRADI